MITAVAWAPPSVAPPPRPAEDPPAPRVARQTCCPGVVTAVDGRSVTIRGFDRRDDVVDHQRGLYLVSVAGRPAVLCTKIEVARHLLTLTLPNGDRAVFRREDMPERRFPVNDYLAAGGHHPWESSGNSYRLADLQVGDEVVLELEGEGPEGVVRAVRIDRRPGGRVPPAPANEPGDPRAWHLQANAYQDWEERGIPLPDHLDPEKQIAAALQRIQERAARDRLAPPPRAVERAAGPDLKPREPLLGHSGEVTAADANSITVRGFRYGCQGGNGGRMIAGGTVFVNQGNPLVVFFEDRAVVCTMLRQSRTLLALTLPNGDDMLFWRMDQPALRFRYDPAAAGGRPLPKSMSYRPWDVRVGDEVSIECRPVGDEDVCCGICIWRRPGGLVPPAPGEDADEVIQWHVGANEQQAFEEHGIPLPTDEESRARYKQRYLAREARLEKEAERRAPPPREVKPKPPGP
ncbi:MAG: hypothetical protein K2X87_11540 [Gemmataceae bacterium]|nr:hypothetical protein [Gemmataceae bacterium]